MPLHRLSYKNLQPFTGILSPARARCALLKRVQLNKTGSLYDQIPKTPMCDNHAGKYLDLGGLAFAKNVATTLNPPCWPPLTITPAPTARTQRGWSSWR
jgi:hypothetical protein